MARLKHSSTGSDDTRIALLRAVNVSGHNRVTMEDLRRCVTDAGCADVRSLLQTGNLVFRAPRTLSDDSLERKLAAVAAAELGITTEYFVRTRPEWRAIVERNPFPKEARTDPGRLIVMALKGAPPKSALEALRAAIQGRERVEIDGRQAYILYPDGVGRSRLTITVIERTLGTRGTARNWNTVLKLDALAWAP
jgi:uncharacterized protein (DUF1697 family)